MSARRLAVRLGDRALGLAGVIGFLLLWELVPRLGIVSDAYLSPPSQVADAIWQLAHSGALLKHVAASLQRSLWGLLLAIGLGVTLGLLMGWLVLALYLPVLQMGQIL